MPKKNKSQSNGFYVYMQELRQSLMSENKGNKITIENMIAIAGPKWKDLTDNERKHYNQLAKSQKKKAMKTDDDRLDNQGNVIGHRTNYDEENLTHRERNKEIDYCRWPPVEDILEHKFYWISFQTLCEIDEGESWLPCEVALVEWSLKDGITNTYQSFIDPGPIPLGYRFTCQSHSDDTHKIPIEGFELADSDYGNIYRMIEYFVNPRGDRDLYPPIYSLHTANGKEWRCSEYCMEWLYRNAQLRTPNHLHKIYCLEDMVMGLYELAEQPISESSAIKLLTVTTWDYEKNTRCSYHEELEVKDCALAVCKRFGFALSDALKNLYEFELTARHVPIHDQCLPAYTIVSPSELDRRPARNRVSSNVMSRFEQHSDEAGPSREVFNNRTLSVTQPNKGLWARPEGVNIDVPTTFAGRRLAPDPGTLPKPVRWQAQQTVGSTSLCSSIAQSAPQWVTRPQVPPLGRGFTPQEAAAVPALQPNAKSQFSSSVPQQDPGRLLHQQQILQQRIQQQEQHLKPHHQQQIQRHQRPPGITNNGTSLPHSAGVGRARGRGQPRQAAGGPGMMAPPAVTRTLGVGRGFPKSVS